MGGFHAKPGEHETAHRLHASGLTRAEIARRMHRSSGFVKDLLDKPVAVPAVPLSVQAAPSIAVSVPLTPERRALADLVLGLDMPKDDKLKVLAAIL